MNDVTAGTLEGATLSAAAMLIDHVCANNSNGKLFYLATCKVKSQTLVPVTSTSTQFKACYVKTTRVTRKVSNSTTCRDTENTIPKVPANSSSLYFCVDSDGLMYFKGRSEPTCGARRFAVEIGPHNRPPTAGNDGPYSVQEDGGPLSVAAPGVLANDSDPDSDPITAQLVTGTGPSHATSFTLNPDGSFSYTPAADYNGSDSFSYKAKDTHNALSATATVTITVTPVNDSPTNIALSNASVDENKPAGTTVGTLSTTDPDTGDTHSYTLVSGTGDEDNGSFQISGDTLQTNEEFDFEAKDSYSVRVKTDDGQGGTFEKQLTISITNANDQPSDVSLSNDDVDENQPAGTDVGTLSTTDQDSADAFTYTLVSGTGDTDNGSFQISGSTLQTAGPLNFEDGATRSVRVQTSDGNGGTFEKSFTVTVNDANDAPTNLALSNNTVEENQPSGATVGTFSAGDADGDTLSFAFASGTGDTDNGSFQISGDTLQTNEEFDFEAKDTYSIRVKADDGNGGTFEEEFTILVGDINDAPTDIELSSSSVDENQPSGTTVGTLSSADQDTTDSHIYTLVSGTGDEDNGSFQISGDTLQTNAVFDSETKDSYTIRVKTDDGNGGTFEKQLTISITDANDAPTDITLSNSSVIEHQPSGTTVGTLSTTDQDSADTHTYALVSGTGSTDNGQFQIVGGELRTSASFNFEVKNSYSVRVSTTDNGSPSKSFEEAFTISINDVNDAPVATADTYSGAIGNTKASRGVTVSGEPVVALTGNVLTNNDTDEDQPAQPLSAVAETVSSTGGGTVTIDANGNFTFLPGVGDKNQNDTFTYHVTDGTATSSGTVTVGIANALVWYVDNAKATNGDGRSSSPFNTLSGINAAGGTGDSDGSGDILFLYQGSGNYTGGLPLEANQQLLGQPNGLTVNNGASNVTLVSPSGSNPTITNSSGNGITLASGNTIRSVNVGNATGGSGISGNTFGTLDIGSVGINTTGQALNLTTGTLSGSLSGVSSSGGTNNVLLSGVGTSGSTFALGSGSLSGASSDAFKVIGSGSYSYSGNVSQANSGAPLVSVSGGHSGTLTFGTGTLSATGGTGLQFDNADGTYNFNGTTTLNGGDAGIDILNGSTGTFDFGAGTTITNPSGTAFNLSGATASNATVTYSGNISKNNAGPAINIDNHDANTISFQTGTLSSTGTSSGIRVLNSNGGTINFNQPTKTLNTGTNAAIALSTNTGGTMNFGGGGLDIDTTSGAGFSATGGGTITVGTGANPNTIDSTTGTALNVANTTIGDSDLTFRRIASNGASNGINLNSTSNVNGTLAVTGNGTSCTSAATCTGGAIQNSTGTGVSLTSVPGGVSLTRIFVNDSADDGIAGSNVTGLNLDNATVTSNGNVAQSGGVHGEHGVDFSDLTGTSTFTNSNVSNNIDSNVVVSNASGVSNLNVTGGSYSGATGGMGDGIFVEGTGTGSQNLNVQGPITFSNNVGDHVQHSADADNTTDSDVTINNATMTSPAAANGGPFCANNILGGGIVISHGGAAVGGSNLDATVTNNNIQNSCIGAIAVGTTGSVGDQQFAQVDATIQNNTIGTAGVAGSGSVQGNGIFVDSNGNGLVRTLITGNTIRQWTNRNGIALDILDGDAEMSATVRGNLLTEPNSAFPGTSTRGMTIQLGSAQAGDSIDACLDIGHATDNALKNTLTDTGEGIQPDVRYLHEGPGSVVQLAGFSGTADQTNITNWFTSRNIFGPTPVVSGLFNPPSGASTTGVASCPLPAG